MGRGVSSGGGQSSLGYLFGSDEPAKAAPARAQPVQNAAPLTSDAPRPSKPQENGPAKTSKPQENGPEVPAGVQMHSTNTNNYFRAEGQNCGNFITDRPSTKVHAAPGGGSSLGYLFGGPPSK
ncbi:hypothetical protein SUGI_1030550 [Cryptomeria japonica]|uniref:protein SPIRAL1-like 2 n=1 Tax=Cryptomeria japonica TaxID=3369 RepID=UPI002414A6E6|nr:protein SPIRAL1-like 2 [Cryptomeria japonica]XP_057869163.1 protein SPIRAL1-like 2 [Cryptomeria japonica]GLJ48864.1 hypothetical protein SUGI_1030550 [Cryptomeria japonica]